MLRFNSFRRELISEDEKSDLRGKGIAAGGIFHELEVAKHLNGGKIPHKEPDKHGFTPEAAHKKHKDIMLRAYGHEHVQHAEERAKSTADHIRKHYAEKYPGHSIHAVHWTSKPGDVHKVTRGVAGKTQAEEPGDLVVELRKHPGDRKAKRGISESVEHNRPVYSAISLKKSEKPKKQTSAGNSGLNILPDHVAEKIRAKHKERLGAIHPDLGGSNVKARRAATEAYRGRSDAATDESVKHVAHEIHKHFNSLHGEHKANWLRKHVLRSKPSKLHHHPDGHENIRVSTDQTAAGFRHKITSPTEEHGNELDDGHNLHAEKSKSGMAVHIHHRGPDGKRKEIATLAPKATSRSDAGAGLSVAVTAKHDASHD